MSGTRRTTKRQAAGVESSPGAYHHGDLRNALLRAAEKELAENGLANFSLRACARRAGVSHAAPAHHFGDMAGLLAALAVDAFDRLAATMQKELDAAEAGKLARVVAVSVGYLRFAVANPELFRLMFRLQELAPGNLAVQSAGGAAFALLSETMGEYFDVGDPLADRHMATRVAGVWSLAHGLADLAIAGQFRHREVDLDALLSDLVRDLLR